jgi:hypothetical protein
MLEIIPSYRETKYLSLSFLLSCHSICFSFRLQKILRNISMVLILRPERKMYTLRTVYTGICDLHVCTVHQQYQSTFYFSTMMHTIIKSQEYYNN